MTPKKTITKFFLLFVLSMTLLTSCSNEDSPSIKSPVVTYISTNLDAIFFTSGSSPAPEVIWNGNQGEFSLETPITGLSIDATTGALSWSKDLPIDTHNIQILASNSAGETAVDLTIYNPLQGDFIGTLDNNLFYQIVFNSDNTTLMKENDDTDFSTGTWTKNGSIINIDFTYQGDNLDYSLSGTLILGTDAVYSGDWYNEYGSISGNEGGIFEVILQ